MNFSMDYPNTEVSTGTTIMAAEFIDGVVIGADSRTSIDRHVVNRVTDKLTPITDKIYCCRSGSAADTQFMTRLVREAMYASDIANDGDSSVWEAACHFREHCYNFRTTCVAGILIAGWDSKQCGQVYNVMLGGMIVRESVATGGSGSGYLHTFIKSSYKPNMDKSKCIEVIKNAIKYAIKFDNHSGGVIRIGVITSSGIQRYIFYNTINGYSEVDNGCIVDQWNSYT